jgi:hypothetical protein
MLITYNLDNRVSLEKPKKPKKPKNAKNNAKNPINANDPLITSNLAASITNIALVAHNSLIMLRIRTNLLTLS